MTDTYQNGSIVRKPRKRGPDVWIFRYYENDLAGNKCHRSVIFSNVVECPRKSDAEKKALDLRKKVNEQRIHATFGDLCDRYEANGLPSNPHTKQGYLGNLKHLRSRWAPMRIADITSNIMAVELWLNSLKDEGGNDYSKQTRQHIRNLMHTVFKHGMLLGLVNLQINPIKLVTVKGGRKKRRNLILTAEQIETLRRDEKLPEHVKAIINVAVCTGMRISEILGLRWEDVNFANSTLAILRRADGSDIAKTKSEESEQECYPMDPVLADALKEWRKVSVSQKGWIFESAQTERPFHARSLAKCHLRPAGVRAGIKGLGWHTFRHTYRAMLADLGEPLEVQQALMRHSDPRMTMEYGKFSAGRQKRLAGANSKVVALVREAR